MFFDVPVLNRSEIVIAGAGPAGIAAGLAAARLGKKVTLVEQSGTPGGLGTAGLVPAVICQSDGVQMLAGEICRSIVEECCSRMGIPEMNPMWQEVDPEIMKRIYDRRILEAGIRLYYGVKAVETEVEERRIGALIVSTPRGLRKIEGELFLDCTGDAAVAALAGVPFHKGDENGDTMAPTLCVQFSNVDIAAYRASIAENGNDLDIWHRLLKAGKAPLDEHHFVGVCTYGNVTMRTAVRNTVALLELLGHPEIPVLAGADRALAATEQDEELLRTLVTALRDDLPRLQAGLEAARELAADPAAPAAHTAEALRRAAHALKNSAATLCFEELRLRAAALEQAARQALAGTPENAEGLMPLAAACAAALARAEEVLRREDG